PCCCGSGRRRRRLSRPARAPPGEDGPKCISGCGNRAATRPRITGGSRGGNQEDGPVRPPGRDSVVKELRRPLREDLGSERFEAFWYTEGSVGALRPGPGSRCL